MKIKETPGSRFFQLVNTVLMLFVVVVTLYPFIYVLSSSLSDGAELMKAGRVILLPRGFSVKSYAEVFKNGMIVTGYANTLFVLMIGVPLNLLLTSFAAYFLSRRGIMLKKAVMIIIIITMYFNGGMVPFYLIVKDMGLYDSLWALILPVAINTYNMIIMRTAFEGIPASLEESAKIDGAQDFTILFRIIMPLSLPTVAVMILYYAVGHWNSWFNAMLFIKERGRYPLQLVLREILIQNDTNSMTAGASTLDQVTIGESVKYAVIITATLPILAVYPFLQKYFVKGVMIGAVKG